VSASEGPFRGSRVSLTSVGRMAEVRLGKMLQPMSSSEQDLEVPYLRAGHLSQLPDELPRMWASPKEIAQYQVEAGDILVAEGGDVGRVGFVPQSAAGALIQNSLHRVRPTGGRDRRFLAYVLEAVHLGDWLEVLCNKSTFGHLTVEKLTALRVPDPPATVQVLIADYLDVETARIDALITKKQRMIELLRQREIAMLETVLLVGDGPGSARFEGHWTPFLPADWSISPIKHLAHCSNSGAWGEEPGIHEVDLPVATTAQIDSEGQFHTANMTIRSFTPDEAARYRCSPGDIVVVKSSGSATNIISGKAGLVSEADESFVFSNFLMRLRPDAQRVDPGFLYLALVSHLTKQRIERMVSATTYPNLQVGEYLSAKVPVPPLVIQRQLLDEFDRRAGGIRSLRVQLSRSIDLLRERRQALITAAVTGELEVPGVAA
jgi:type I restriction enzyme, S subunit